MNKLQSFFQALILELKAVIKRIEKLIDKIMATKNLGQVAGVYIGNTPPENIILIWYDNTPSQMCHKVYDTAKKTWVILDQNIVSSITYSELVNIAKNVGLAVGKYFQIKDKGNALALAITSTKVQYSDALGNILIDDLGTNIQYHVTSSNLLVDDVAGVFDEVNKKLVFQFKETVPDFTADDYVFGKVQRNNVWSLAKYKLSSFLSKVTGNSITWNGGFFFDFSKALKGQLDKKGGVVAKDSYDRDMEQISSTINNIGKANQNIIDNTNKAIKEATSDQAIYNKALPYIETGGVPTDVTKGDSLVSIISNFQRFINKFKYATGVRMSKDFKSREKLEDINNNDTVDSALRKTQPYLTKIRKESDGVLLSRDLDLGGLESEFDKDMPITNIMENLGYEIVHSNNRIYSLIENQYHFMRFDRYIETTEDLLKLPSLIQDNDRCILIKKGTYTIDTNNSIDIDLTAFRNRNLWIVFEHGVVIEVHHNLQKEGERPENKHIFYSSSAPANMKDTIHFELNGCTFNGYSENNDNSRISLFNNLRWVNNFNAKGYGDAAYFCVTNCRYIRGCYVHNESGMISFLNCIRLEDCIGYFSSCELLFNCDGEFSSNIYGLFCTGVGFSGSLQPIEMPTSIDKLNTLDIR